MILEKSDAVGGTWRDNTYPGASCDYRSHLYWFSFDAQPDWSRVYVFQRPEIQANIERLVDRLGLRWAHPHRHHGHRRALGRIRLGGRDQGRAKSVPGPAP